MKENTLSFDISNYIQPSNIAVDLHDLGARKAFLFGTKSHNLDSLRRHASTFHVLPQICIHGRQWEKSGSELIDIIWNDPLMDHPLIVRSSYSAEDSTQASHAGEFKSILNISSKEELRDSIDSVFASYGAFITNEHVLVQPMAKNVALSGVIMTADAQSGAPYTIINYAIGHDTEAVTSGAESTQKFIFLNGHYDRIEGPLKPLAPVLHELNKICHSLPIDVEFAITERGDVIVFQLRPIVLNTIRHDSLRDSFPKLVDGIHRKYKEIVRHNELVGLPGNLFGVMPDWNPAELIGIKPKPLAYSLYRYLVTDDAWAKGRVPLGYSDMTGFALMRLIGGTPFISLETSLSSFVPASIPIEMRMKIVHDACSALVRAPQNHDKIEFSIMPTIYNPEITSKGWRDSFPSLNDEEWIIYTNSLLELTNGILDSNGSYEKFKTEFAKFVLKKEEDISHRSSDLMSVRTLLSKVKDQATPLFSTAARAAFVATDILKSLARMGLITQNYIDHLSQRAETVGSQLVKNYFDLDRHEFMRIYGHIRPGTFDITVPRYDADPVRYFSSLSEEKIPTESDSGKNKNLGDNKKREIDSLFESIGYKFDWDRFEQFAIDAINARENVKFHYTKLVSDALEIVAHVGARHGYSRETMSFLTLADIENLLDFNSDIQGRIAMISGINRAYWQKHLPVRLPELLTKPDDVYAFQVLESTPNFITNKIIEGIVGDAKNKDINGKIVFIENADPGYDWIFTHGIKGFVTKYGGENSHMAIRAREFSLPAVIGAGNSYDEWRLSAALRIDCAVKHVEVIS